MYITDLDNTLLGTDGLLSDYSLKHLKELIKEVDVTFATARSLFTSGVVLDFLEFRLPFIVSNGAAIIDPLKGYIHTFPIERTLFDQIIDLKLELNPFVIGVYKGSEILLHRTLKSEVERRHLEKRLDYNDKRQTLVEEFDQVDEVLNLVYVGEFDEITRIEDSLSSFEGLTVYKYAKSKKDNNHYYLDITSKEATKGNAVKVLCELLNIPLKSVTAFGDDVNDVSMFNVVGTPLLPDNSKLELDYMRIGPNGSDSVVKYIEDSEIRITKIDELTFNLDELVSDSREEDFNFVRRLRDEYITGYNNFTQRGEVLYLAHIGSRVIGCGGLNIDPYLRDDSYGRVRHLYVLKAFRGRNIATMLLDRIINDAKRNFKVLTLRTFSSEASSLYLKNGFTKSSKIDYATHYMRLGGE